MDTPSRHHIVVTSLEGLPAADQEIEIAVECCGVDHRHIAGVVDAVAKEDHVQTKRALIGARFAMNVGGQERTIDLGNHSHLVLSDVAANDALKMEGLCLHVDVVKCRIVLGVCYLDISVVGPQQTVVAANHFVEFAAKNDGPTKSEELDLSRFVTKSARTDIFVLEAPSLHLGVMRMPGLGVSDAMIGVVLLGANSAEMDRIAIGTADYYRDEDLGAVELKLLKLGETENDSRFRGFEAATTGIVVMEILARNIFGSR